MSVPVTSLQDIILLAHQQYGIRFQLTQQQLVDFANTIQYIAYNQDTDAFVEWGQTFFLGQNLYLEADSGTYTAPVESDIGKIVVGSVTGAIGILMNFQTINGINHWIVEPTGTAKFTLGNAETITITGGTGAGKVVEDQDYIVSSGPYRTPKFSDGKPPFRKFIGVTSITDKQFFQVPPNSGYDGPDDYGLLVDAMPGRHSFIPHRFNAFKEEVSLVLSTEPEIEATGQKFGPSGTSIKTSKLRWVYYRNCNPIIDINDSLDLPERYRYEILYKGIAKLADTATYGEDLTVRQIIEPLCQRFWEDMRNQYQAMGRGSDFISHGDNWGDGYPTGYLNRGYRSYRNW